MGLDYHGLSFLRYVHRQQGDFGDTATIGRQEIHVRERGLKSILSVDEVDAGGRYCEKLIQRYFGAPMVESIDYSSYERASHVHDMGIPLPERLQGRYDTVVDAGTLEHVFNIVQAFANCADLVRPGGQIIHILPANNYLGHGFWQMSPELFFSLYSEANGYRDTEVYLANFMDNRHWYKVKPPSEGRRVYALSSNEMYILVRTVKAVDQPDHVEVQQSDYVYEWEHRDESADDVPPPATRRSLKHALLDIPVLSDRLLLPLYQRLFRLAPSRRVSGRNPGLEAVSIKALTRD